eukprot:5195909-Pleurochrysis_carterae.AAC.1
MPPPSNSICDQSTQASRVVTCRPDRVSHTSGERQRRRRWQVPAVSVRAAITAVVAATTDATSGCGGCSDGGGGDG